MTEPPVLMRARLVLPDRMIENGQVLVVDGRLAEVGPARPDNNVDVGEVLRLPGLTVLPGLVDLHCHGGGGASFADSEEQAVRAAEEHLRGGTTSVMASLVSAPLPQLEAQLARLAALAAVGTVAGVHLEGPWLAAQFSGAHDPQHLRAPNLAAAERLVEDAAGWLRVATLAPELPGALPVAQLLAAAGVIVAVGHTAADYQQASAMLNNDTSGANLVTHLFNGMPALHHRIPGPVAAALHAAARGRAVVELIADGVHLDDATVSLVFALLGPERIALVSDATAATGMPDGRYDLGGLDVVVDHGVARLATTGPTPRPASLAGSTCTLMQVVQRTVAAGVPLVDAVRAASATPAQVLGDPGVGALEVGRRADLVVVDAMLRPVAVMRAGRWCWGTERLPVDADQGLG